MHYGRTEASQIYIFHFILFGLTQRVQKHDKEGAPAILEQGVVVVKELIWDNHILNNKHTGDK